MKLSFMLEEQVHSKWGMCMPITLQTPGRKGTLLSNSKSAPPGRAAPLGRMGKAITPRVQPYSIQAGLGWGW